MIIYAIDSDFYELKTYENVLGKTKRNTVRLFTGAAKAWQACLIEMPDVIFIEHDSFNYKPLIAKIQAASPNTKIVLGLTGPDLEPQMVGMDLFDVLRKPISEQQLGKLMNRLSHPSVLKRGRRSGSAVN